MSEGARASFEGRGGRWEMTPEAERLLGELSLVIEYAQVVNADWVREELLPALRAKPRPASAEGITVEVERVVRLERGGLPVAEVRVPAWWYDERLGDFLWGAVTGCLVLTVALLVVFR